MWCLEKPFGRLVDPLYVEGVWLDMLPVRFRETGMRVPLGALTGEMGRLLSETCCESAERDDTMEYGCETARGRREGEGRAPE